MPQTPARTSRAARDTCDAGHKLPSSSGPGPIPAGPSRRSRAGPAGAILLLAAALLLAADEAEVLTNEDVVRMAASGMPAERIVERIAASDCRFDVAPDMIEELRLAGVPETVLDAMVAKARSSGPPPAPTPAPAAAGRVEIVFEDAPDGPPEASSALFPTRLSRRGSLRDPVPVQVALGVLCTDSVHAPDAWMRRTPMDEEFPRHHVLFFREATAPASGRLRKGYVYLAHPPAWSFEAEPGRHSGIVVVALRAPGVIEAYSASVTAPFEGLLVESGRRSRIRVRLRAPSAAPRIAGGEVTLPDPSFASLGTIESADPDLRSRLEVVGVDPPAPIP
jgi:hypothetical protein